MTGRLEGKVALITGGSSGIGESTVRRFVEEGAACVICDIQADRGEALAAELGDAACFTTVDVTEEADVTAAVDLALVEFGRLDCTFNNAGVVGVVGPIAETDAAAWDRTIAVLLRSVFLGIKQSARVMIPQGSGSIISTSSTAGVMGGLGPHAYTAAKHGVVGLTKSAASELGPQGIRVNAVAPGNIVTPLTADVVSGDHTDLATAHDHIEASSPLGRAGLPVDIANVAVFLASDEAAYVNGHTLVADAGQTTGGRVSRFAKSDPTEILEAGRREQ